MTTPVDIGTMIARTPGYSGGKPRLVRTGITVIAIGLLAEGGETPAEIISCHYPHLTLAEVHAALAYFHANRAEIDEILEAEDRAWEKGVAEQAARGLRF